MTIYLDQLFSFITNITTDSKKPHPLTSLPESTCTSRSSTPIQQIEEFQLQTSIDTPPQISPKRNINLVKPYRTTKIQSTTPSVNQRTLENLFEEIQKRLNIAFLLEETNAPEETSNSSSNSISSQESCLESTDSSFSTQPNLKILILETIEIPYIQHSIAILEEYKNLQATVGSNGKDDWKSKKLSEVNLDNLIVHLKRTLIKKISEAKTLQLKLEELNGKNSPEKDSIKIAFDATPIQNENESILNTHIEEKITWFNTFIKELLSLDGIIDSQKIQALIEVCKQTLSDSENFKDLPLLEKTRHLEKLNSIQDHLFKDLESPLDPALQSSLEDRVCNEINFPDISNEEYETLIQEQELMLQEIHYLCNTLNLEEPLVVREIENKNEIDPEILINDSAILLKLLDTIRAIKKEEKLDRIFTEMKQTCFPCFPEMQRIQNSSRPLETPISFLSETHLLPDDLESLAFQTYIDENIDLPIKQNLLNILNNFKTRLRESNIIIDEQKADIERLIQEIQEELETSISTIQKEIEEAKQKISQSNHPNEQSQLTPRLDRRGKLQLLSS